MQCPATRPPARPPGPAPPRHDSLCPTKILYDGVDQRACPSVVAAAPHIPHIVTTPKTSPPSPRNSNVGPVERLRHRALTADWRAVRYVGQSRMECSSRVSPPMNPSLLRSSGQTGPCCRHAGRARECTGESVWTISISKPSSGTCTDVGIPRTHLGDSASRDLRFHAAV